MIAVDNHRQETQATWQAEFVAMLPEIQQRLRHAFRHLRAEAAEDAIEEGVIHALLSYVRLFEQGRAESASAIEPRLVCRQAGQAGPAGCRPPQQPRATFSVRPARPGLPRRAALHRQPDRRPMDRSDCRRQASVGRRSGRRAPGWCGPGWPPYPDACGGWPGIWPMAARRARWPRSMA